MPNLSSSLLTENVPRAIIGKSVGRVAVLLGSCLVVSCATDLTLQAQQQDRWPGLPPDCWTEDRVYQTDDDAWDWPSRTIIERVAKVDPEVVTTSPNGVYYFSLTNPESLARRSITVFSEKDHLVRITFADTKGLDIRWINERLLYMRAWWGRISATDMLFDVEKENFVHTESVHWGVNDFAQYRQMCALHGGCKCIQKAPQ